MCNGRGEGEGGTDSRPIITLSFNSDDPGSRVGIVS